MYCKKCGKELPENALVCPYCAEPVNPSTQPADNGKNSHAIIGFTGSLISAVCWVCFLIIAVYGRHNLGIYMFSLLGIVMSIICIVSLYLSLSGLLSSANNRKYRALALSGVIVSATFFTSFVLLTTVIGCLV